MTVMGFCTLIVVGSFLSPDRDQIVEDGDMGLSPQIAEMETSNEWLTSYDEARARAIRDNLPLLLHFDASWCGACRQMQTQVLEKHDVTDLLGRSFVGVRIDADRYKNLIREYGISTLPTEVVVSPDGSRSERFVGAVSLGAYVTRLKQLEISSTTNVAESETKSEDESDQKSVRSCLIVQHDGKTVGMGGYSPVTLVAEKQWVKGSEEFVATHEGVEYFLQSQDELVRFNAAPQKYMPRLHGCDLVELQLENRATTGAIEYGAFYQGKVFFFASFENRSRFENNPTWYMGAMTDARTANDEMLPFLNGDAMEN